jgi:2-polyprenyl-6-methoxyphenol hydroxylase-like FAD-dependent oxidoreductase
VFPMVDRDPLPTWTFGRMTLIGDAAHPMYPRGSNGAGQSILDARFMTGCFQRHGVTAEALQEYDKERVAKTGAVVLMNRVNPPDTILQLVYERTGGKPFDNIDDVISQEELKAVGDRYKEVAGFEAKALRERASLVSA